MGRPEVAQLIATTKRPRDDVVSGRGTWLTATPAPVVLSEQRLAVPAIQATVLTGGPVITIAFPLAGRAARAWRRRPTVDAGTHQGSTTRSRLARITSVLHRGRRPRLPSLSAYQPTASAPLGPRTRATADAAPPRCRPGTCRGPSHHDPPRSASRIQPARGRTGCGPSSGHGW